MSKYKRPFSVNYRKPVVLDSSDPRYKNLERYRSRLGRKVIVKDLPIPTSQPSALSEPECCDYWVVQTTSIHGSYKVLPYNNGVYVAGSGNIGPTDGTTIVNYDLCGNLNWVKTLVHSENVSGIADFVDVDVFGNIYISYTMNQQKSPNIIIIKINNSGQKVWEKIIDYPSGTYTTNRVENLKIDKNNNLYVAFELFSHTLGSSIMLIKFDYNGNELLRTIFKSPEGTEIFSIKKIFIDMSFDSNNNLAFVIPIAINEGQPNGLHYWIVKYNENFQHIDSFIISSPETTFFNSGIITENSITAMPKILLDNNSNYILIGEFTSSPDGTNINQDPIRRKSVIKINSDKTLSWAKTFYDYHEVYFNGFSGLFASYNIIFLKNIDIDSDNNIYIGKVFNAGDELYPGPNGAIIKFLPDGQVSWVNKNSVSGEQNDRTQSLKVYDNFLYFIAPGQGGVMHLFKVPTSGAYASTNLPPLGMIYEQDSISFISNLDFTIAPSALPYIRPEPLPYYFYSSNSTYMVDGLGLDYIYNRYCWA